MKEPTVTALSNNAPINETARMEIDERLVPFRERLKVLEASFETAKCDNPEDAGKVADLVKLLRSLKKAIDATRVDVKQPYADAVSAVDSAPKPLTASIDNMDKRLRQMLADLDTRIRNEEAAKRRVEEQRLAEERRKEQAERDRLAEVARQQNVAVPEPVAEVAPTMAAPQREAPTPIASGDYGAAAHRSVRKVPEIVDMYALPPEVIEAPDVQEAALKVIRRLRLANPDIVIPGMKLVEQHGLSIR